MTKIFPVQTAQPDSLLARPGPAAALAPAPHLPAEPARPRHPLRPGPSRAARARRPLPPAAGPQEPRRPPPRWLPAVRGLRGAAGPRLMAVREGRACAATPIQRGSQRPAAKPQLILRGEPTPRAGRSGCRAGILPGPPTPQRSRKMDPGRSERSVACGERGADATGAAAGQRKPCAAAAAGGSGGTSGCGAVRGGAAAAPPPSLRGSSAGASLPSGGFLGSLPLFAGVFGGLTGFVLVKKSCPSSPEPKRAPAGRRPSRHGRAQVNSMEERQRPGPGSSSLASL